MSDAILIRDLSKKYKFFKTKAAKIADLLGLSINKNYEEFWALKDVSLTIRKGEKVGFIGRNGAGKTTLLNIIAGNSAPTSGTVKIEGKVNALFTLGTGFHPEFTGRENIISSLAFQGVTGKGAQRLSEEIIEFSELEEFINQPVKTYSAGMYARLAFTVATAIKPEILIIDEILGAGDAYFSSKALERMKELTGEGTTVLFVSHDLSSVQQLCDRCVWIERGKVVSDGDALNVIKEYSADVRKREEARLKTKNARALNKEPSGAEGSKIIFRFIGDNGSAPKQGLPVHKISLILSGSRYSEICVGDSMDNASGEDAHIMADQNLFNWSKPYRIEGRWVRDFKDLGAKYIHAAGVFILPAKADPKDVAFEIEYNDALGLSVDFQVYSDQTKDYISLKTLKTTGTGKWSKVTAPLAPGSGEVERPGINDFEGEIDVYGLGKVSISGVEFKGENGSKKFVFREGELITLVINLDLLEKLEGYPYVCYCLFDAKGNLVCNFFEEIKIRETGSYAVEIGLNNSGLLKSGRYFFSFALYKEINPLDISSPWPAYIVLDRKIEIQIFGETAAVPMGIIDLGNAVKIERQDGR